MPFSAEQKRAYRAQRKAEGRPVPSGSPRNKPRKKRTAEQERARRARRSARDRAAARFVAWDGEGVTVEEASGPDPVAWQKMIEALPRSERKAARARSDAPKPGKHAYIMLANSRGAYIEADDLSTKRCFDFLLDTASALPKNVVHVIFGGSYDANMMFRDLERADLEAIAAGERVDVTLGGATYRVYYRPRKELFVAKFGHPKYVMKGGKRVANYTQKIRLWDVVGFFQAKFVDAIEEYKLFADRLDTIARMKAQRSHFTLEQRDEIRAYCLEECVMLGELYQTFWDAMLDAGRSLDAIDGRGELVMKRHDGAGAVAVALLNRQGVRVHVPDRTEGEVDLALRTAYAGGRIEITKIGRGPLYDRDINSAYPAAAVRLPSGRGRWFRGMTGEHYVARVAFRFPDDLPFYPLFVRIMGGGVQFPAAGEGWYHAPEVEAAQEFAEAFGGIVDIRDAFTWRPDSDARPFDFIPQVYELRKQWKIEKPGAQKILKLGLNSIYGKTCQQLGATDDRCPPFFSLQWAGAITSATRAKLVTAAIPIAESVVMFATDGLFTDEPSGISTSDRLGEWSDGGSAADAVVAQAGVYWQFDGEWSAKYRGFDRSSAPTPAAVLAAWAKREREIHLPTTRFITLKSALASKALFPYWRTWRTVLRSLSIDGRSVKRCGIDARDRPDLGWVDLRPTPPIAPGMISLPYETWYSDHAADAALFSDEFTDDVPSAFFENEVLDALL